MDASRVQRVRRRGLLIGGAIALIQAAVFALGWLVVYEDTHEEVARGVEDVIVQSNIATAQAVVTTLEGLPNVDDSESEAWRRTQDVIEGLELGGEGFACALDSDGFISCHPDIVEQPGLRSINLASESFRSLSGESRGKVGEEQGSGVQAGIVDFGLGGKHYLATVHDPTTGTRLMVHQPVSGLEAASAHITSAMWSSMIGILVLLMSLTGMLAMALVRGHDRTMERWNGELEGIIDERTEQLVKSHRTVLFGIAKLAEYRDNDTGKHVERMCAYSRILAEEYQRRFGEIEAQWIEDVELAAAMHDIGKVSIPDRILLKPGKLTSDEFDRMKEHANVGKKALLAVRDQAEDTRLLDLGVEIAGSHHEKWNGRGYPQGLVGSEIPLSARIVAVADVFDALMSKRVYKPEFPFHEVCKIIRSESGQHFDPSVVVCFEEVADELRRVHQANLDVQDPPPALPHIEARASEAAAI